MELYDHQKKIINEDPKWTGLFLGTGGCKTRTAEELAVGKVIVVCPKQQKLDQTWEKNADKFGIPLNMTVVSKEEFRRDHKKIGKCDTLIVDEGHHHLGVRPETCRKNGETIPKTSQIFDATRWYLKYNRPERFYLLTATVGSKPMNVWAAAKLLGLNWDFFKFRNTFYIERKMGYRSIWIPRMDEARKEYLAQLVKKLGYVGRLEDWFDVPEQTFKTVYVELTAKQKWAIRTLKEEEADPLVKNAKMRTIENGVLYKSDLVYVSDREERIVRSAEVFPSEKIEYILERADEFDKILVFAAFTAQVEEIAKKLKEAGHKNVYTLTGATKDRKTVIESAEASERAVVIAQASISEGYELPSFPCVIWASLSNKFRDYDQGKGRVLRANALKKNLYVHLIVKGGADERCYKAIMSGNDFQEKIYS